MCFSAVENLTLSEYKECRKSAVENLTLSEYKECRKKEKDYRSRGGDPWS